MSKQNLLFLVLESIFGYSSGLPFRIVAFLVQFANMALFSAIVWRITGSRIAGFLAPILWMASDKMSLTMAWDSNINYIACGFWILTALWCLLMHIDTNRTVYLVLMWIAFAIGLGTLEMMIVFPVIAAAYTFVRARPYFRKVLWLFPAAALFAILHLTFAPNRIQGGLYTMHFDVFIIRTIAQYWKNALDPLNLSVFTPLPAAAGIAGSIVFTIALAGYVVYQALRRNFIPLILLSWFFTLLLPMMPLRDKVDSYYLGLPMIGLAALAADGFAHAWTRAALWRGMAIALLGFFLFESGLVAHRATWAWTYRSRMDRAFVLGVAEAHRVHPDNDIVLSNVTDLLFWSAISQRCFLFLGINNVYLAPGSEQKITAQPEIGDINAFIMPDATFRQRAGEGRLSVYAWKKDHIEDVTAGFGGAGAPKPVNSPVQQAVVDRVDVGNPRYSDRLSDDWYEIDQGSRWMPRRASLHMRSGDGRTLHVAGYCPAVVVRGGAVHLTVSINGTAYPAVSIEKADAAFEFEFPLPRGVPDAIDVTVQVDRTFKAPPDVRELGLLFGVFEIR